MEDAPVPVFATSCSSQVPTPFSSEPVLNDAAGLEEEPALIVEERLHICAASLACLRHVARLAERESDIPLLSSRERFARVTQQFIQGLQSQLEAIKAALPVSATNLRAPAVARRQREDPIGEDIGGPATADESQTGGGRSERGLMLATTDPAAS